MADRSRRVWGTTLLAIFVASNAGYLFLDPGQSRFIPWFALYTAQFGLLVALVRDARLPLSYIVAAGVAARAILWFSVPVMEGDYWRYLWDGHVWAHGINPYLYAPAHSALDAIETDYRFFVTYAQIPTIYPPVAQFVFWLSHLVAPDSLLGMKVVLTLFDVATGWIVVLWLAERGQSHSTAAWYFLNPLVLKEVANSAHIDIVAVFFATAALFWMSHGTKPLRAWLFLALSVGTKLYAVALAPLFARCDQRWVRHAALGAGALAGVYLPFATAGAQLFAGTAAYGENWIFNASLFRLIETAWSWVLPESTWAPRLTVMLAFLAVVAYATRRLGSRADLADRALLVLGALLLLSPVVDAWYVLWILPLAVVVGSAPWLAFSYLVALSYVWFYSQQAAPYVWILEYGLLFALLARSLAHGRERLSARTRPA